MLIKFKNNFVVSRVHSSNPRINYSKRFAVTAPALCGPNTTTVIDAPRVVDIHRRVLARNTGRSSAARGSGAGRDGALRAATWNLAAPNNNPFEYWTGSNSPAPRVFISLTPCPTAALRKCAYFAPPAKASCATLARALPALDRTLSHGRLGLRHDRTYSPQAAATDSDRWRGRDLRAPGLRPGSATQTVAGARPRAARTTGGTWR